jgi:hypothetical protein
LLDQLQGDASKAAAIVKKELGGAMGGGTAGGSAASKVNNHPDVIAAKVSNQIKTAGIKAQSQQQIAANKVIQQGQLAGARVVATVQMANSRLLTQKARTENVESRTQIQKQIAEAKIQAINAARISRAQGEGGDSKYGIAKFAELYLNFKLLQLALKSLSVVVNGLMDSFKKARDLYSKSLTSGLGIKMTTKMGALSQILGVSEEEVLKFGAAISYIYPQIEDTIKVLEETNGPLAEIQMNIEILKLKFLAVSSVITSSMIAEINKFIDSISAFLDVFKDSDIIQGITGTITKAIELVGLLVSDIAIALQFIYEGFKGLINILINFLALIPGLGIKKMEMGPSKLPSMFNDIGKQFAAFIGQSGKTTGGLPPAQSSMKQISASAWEKMGLVIGGRGNTTNELIRQSNKHLSTIAAAVTGTGIARQSFGMNPTVANP